MRYRLFDTFNNRILSHHRTVDVAVRERSRILRAIRRREGSSSYLPIRIEVRKDSAGAWVAADLSDVGLLV